MISRKRTANPGQNLQGHEFWTCLGNILDGRRRGPFLSLESISVAPHANAHTDGLGEPILESLEKQQVGRKRSGKRQNTRGLYAFETLNHHIQNHKLFPEHGYYCARVPRTLAPGIWL